MYLAKGSSKAYLFVPRHLSVGLFERDLIILLDFLLKAFWPGDPEKVAPVVAYSEYPG